MPWCVVPGLLVGVGMGHLVVTYTRICLREKKKENTCVRVPGRPVVSRRAGQGLVVLVEYGERCSHDPSEIILHNPKIPPSGRLVPAVGQRG
ncbi:hypothetical protein E2C01_047862 [Portunus trituberculatus]|uniref:Uncharacterized protein n=1 Tax=Portunus trituberculatus TaxID=210409 RepID=A0A5B7G8V6_PORTR|nr:hypothetical protein [Portunus trituberculatus]